MLFIADFHLHSKYARATSRDMNLENFQRWAQLKGIRVMSAADFTHPLWFAELKGKLIQDEGAPGLYRLNPALADPVNKAVPSSCRQDVHFILTTEVSCIYSKRGRTRKVHTLIFAPSLEVAEQINRCLALIGNIRADGRPILGLDAKELLKILHSISKDCLLVPAHIWTPHFGIFGSASGFNSLMECFEELTPHIVAAETGLDTDPLMNWRVEDLDEITLISNSDAHSLPKLGREANVLDTELSYAGIVEALKRKSPKKKMLLTIEFFPEEGKYHLDGHRHCKIRMTPQESAANKNLCSKCKKPLTIGVLNRIESLSEESRKRGFHPKKAAPYKKIIPLQEILGEIMGVKPESKRVQSEYLDLVTEFGNEFGLLLKTPPAHLKKYKNPLLAEAIGRMRQDKIIIAPGFDGEYGKVQIFGESEDPVKAREQAQSMMF